MNQRALRSRSRAISIHKPTPITIIGGFLGAGKTSLLKHILRNNHGKKIAVLVNDFGKLNIDAQLIVNVDGETVSLSNGCICCTIRDDLLREVLNLTQVPQAKRPEHIVIETSGVSDPALVAHTFSMAALEGMVNVDSIISMVDTEHLSAQYQRHRQLLARQIEVADISVLNKIDLVDNNSINQARETVQSIAPHARILKATHGQIPIELLLGHSVNNVAPKYSFTGEQTPTVPDFETWTYQSSNPFSLIAIRKLVEDMPSAIYRVKGFVLIESGAKQRCELQMTGGRATLRMGGSWGDVEAITTLVFIAKRGEVSTSTIEALCDHSQAQYSHAAMEQNLAPVQVSRLNALSLVFNHND